jgi:hypothetical protein
MSNMSSESRAGRLAGFLIALLGAGCGKSEDGLPGDAIGLTREVRDAVPPEVVAIEDVIDAPERFERRRITILAEVAAVFSPRAFELEGGLVALVHRSSRVIAADGWEGEAVRATGVVVPTDAPELSEALEIDLNLELETELAGDPVLLLVNGVEWVYEPR